jgi:putative ABC transport system permease protein
VVGVAIAATLTFVQLGLFAGFRAACSAAITHTGGDLWVMRRGTQVFDDAPPLYDGVRPIVAAHPCVLRVRGVVLANVPVKTPNAEPSGAFVVGFEQAVDNLVPWHITRGLPQDLEAPVRVAVDEFDLRRLGLADNPLGARINVGGLNGRVAVLTSGLKTFTLSPYMFSSITNVRAMLNLTEGQSNFWVADLRDPSCADGAIRWITAGGDLDVRRTADFVEQSENFWLESSGAGAILKFGSGLSLLIGGAVVAQTLYALTRDHAKELAALKALGTTTWELTRFVLWQASMLTTLGTLLGAGLTQLVHTFGLSRGMNVVVNAHTLLTGAACMLLVCAISSSLALRAVRNIPPTAVFD